MLAVQCYECNRQLGSLPATGQQLRSVNDTACAFFLWFFVLISNTVTTLCFTLQTSTGLKGTRKLQQFGGISLASSQGISNSIAGLNSGVTGGPAPQAGTGNSFGTGNAVGTGNGFIYSSQGQALSSGTSGGNSTANTALTVLGNSTNGLLTSVGTGQGAAGGNAVFGPSLAAAIAAATPVAAPPAPEVEEVVEENSKGGNNNNNNNAVAPVAPAAPTAPAFYFAQGLPTGGGGGGFGLGSGVTTGNIATAVNGTGAALPGADEAYGSALANGFGFGTGSGVAVNSASEQAGGQGGGTSLGQGQFTFELDDVPTGSFANSGVTKSNGGGGAYVGFDPPTAVIFGNFITPAPAATP
jgi:hypothetical protein